ncbi:MAG: ATP-binding protein [Rikenellaceae bacterium]|nr:ATP-binding protein [Rikenellaceae bacterium]
MKLGPTATPRALVYADRSRVEQVLHNLVSNSIKYGRVNGTTTVNMINLYDEALIEVEDNGIGISEADQKRLFERFYRVDKHRSRDEGGSGLGLTIVKHIIEAHRTQLSVRSEPGKGTVFSFTLQRPPKNTKPTKEAG